MRSAPAFTLIEILIVVAVIALAATALPRLALFEPKTTWQAVEDELNDIAYLARQEAIMSRVLHRLLLRRIEGHDEITIERQMPDAENPDKKTFVALRPGFRSAYRLPDGLSIDSVKVEGEDLWLKNRKGTPLYVTPDGLVQTGEVVLARQQRGQIDKMTFVMQPFLGRWVRGKRQEERA